MSRTDYLPGEDAALKQWLENFAAVCDANNTTLGLTSAEVDAINGYSTNFSSSLNNVAQTKATYQGAVTGKDTQRRSITTAVRALAREFKANPVVPQELLRQLGVLNSSTSGPVRTVTGLTVVGCSNGVNQLKWNRNNNSPATTFIIENTLGMSTNWTFVGVTTRTTFEHEDQTPGEFLRYRIISARAGEVSAPTDPVAIYSNGAGDSLQIAA